MNLHGIVAPYVGAVNPLFTVTVQVSTGPTTAGDGSQTNTYATPGALAASVGGSFTASATGTTLTVSAVLAGSLWPGDAISGAGLPAGTTVVAQLSGTPGGTGTYQLNQAAGPLGPITVTAASTILNASAVTVGVLQVGQTVTGVGVADGTLITGQVSGTTGGVGLYRIGRQQTVASVAMTTSLILDAQIQPITWRDIQQMEGLTLQGTRWKAYLYGQVDGLVRVESKGGDLITIPAPSPHAGVWLVTQVLEQWPDWVVAAITLQDGS